MHNFDKALKVSNPKLHKKLGVVYTPVEIVDFILNSVVDALKIEFNKELKDVKILDPFTGTGVFITRLLQMYDLDGSNVYANEIIEDAYNIAVENIRGCLGGDRVNILLTDTFKVRDGIFDIIIGNPPYSVGQRSANDNNKNDKYEELDKRIADTYVKHSNATLKAKLYDSYVRSLRWASDRIAEQGIIGFVSNGSWINNSSMDGLRHCFENEFSKIYVFDLRGDARSAIRTGDRDLGKREGGNVFEQGSMIKITITLFIKNPNHQGGCKIHYHDIGDYLGTQEKKEIIKNFKSYINPAMQWQILTPNDHNDWINQRSGDFNNFMPLGDKKKLYKNDPIFDIYSLGVATARDPWVYNFGITRLSNVIGKMINDYNALVDTKPNKETAEKLIIENTHSIKWTSKLITEFTNNKRLEFSERKTRLVSYRPFVKKYLFYDKMLNERQFQIPKIFPTDDAENIVISCAGIGSNNFTALITDIALDLHFSFNSQNFPLYHYKKLENIAELDNTSQAGEIVLLDGEEYEKKYAISEATLQKFRAHYKNENITHEDIFYYIYGILNSSIYRDKYQANLSKILPHIPFAPDFHGFAAGGRALGLIHLNYERLDIYQCNISDTYTGVDDFERYYLKKMKFGCDNSIIIYNKYITISGVPLRAYEYKVNGKSAIEWVMNQYKYRQDKDSGIISDPNEWCRECGDALYIINLIKRIITLSLRTLDIIESLPNSI